MKKRANELAAGETIIGDRMYAAGLLDLRIQSIDRREMENGTLVVVHALSGPYDVERMISYLPDDEVVLGGIR